MAIEFKFPDVGEGIHEGNLVKWLVKEGDSVNEDQPLAEVETDKAVVEIPSPQTGTILKLHHKEGETIKVGEIITTIGNAGEKVLDSPKIEQSVSTKNTETETLKENSLDIRLNEKTKEKPTTIPEPITTSENKTETKPQIETVSTLQKQKTKSLATPSVRKYAKEKGININTIIGTGSGGKVTKEDIDSFTSSSNQTQTNTPIQQTQQPTAQQPIQQTHITSTSSAKKPGDLFKHPKIILEGEYVREPLKGIRKVIAEHMERSKYTAPHVVHVEEVDVTNLVLLRAKEKQKALEKGIKLTYLPFIAAATVAALKEFPYVNSSLDDETNEIILKKFYNIGIAVDTEAGLMVPVVRQADHKTIYMLAKEIRELAKKARDRTIKTEEMQGGTFTITNVGSYGGIFSTPIINHPEVAILGVHKIMDVPKYVNGILTKRKIINLALSFDHRVIDGGTAARFVNEIKKHLEDPSVFVLSV